MWVLSGKNAFNVYNGIYIDESMFACVCVRGGLCLCIRHATHKCISFSTCRWMLVAVRFRSKFSKNP